MAAPAGSLRGPAWRTGSIEHQASRTNGHALEEKRGGGKEGEVRSRVGEHVSRTVDRRRRNRF